LLQTDFCIQQETLDRLLAHFGEGIMGEIAALDGDFGGRGMMGDFGL
jgi:hypothetical protein